MELVLALSLIATFVLSISTIIYLTLRPRRLVVERLKDHSDPEGVPPGSTGAAEASSVTLDLGGRNAIQKIARLAPGFLGRATSVQKALVHAGYRSSTAPATFSLIRLMSIVGLPAVGWLFTLGVQIPPTCRLFMVYFLLLLGYVLPRAVLGSRARSRQHRLRLSLPDALDLLVVCVEAGVGLNQAIVRVAEELIHIHPEISEELRIVNLEIRAGKTRTEALRNLGGRTGVEDIVSLASLLIQTDKFGTSITRSLRVHSDSLRTERMQRAEAAAAKTTIKLVFPLLFCIFPALLVVILGPALLQLMRTFSDVVSSVPR